MGLALVLVGLAPGTASALPFTVNSTGDGTDATPGDMVCETATENAVCTLRAAIGETNALGGLDSISFSASVFDGVAANSTIDLTSQLPSITSPVTIDGGACVTGGGDPKPCTAINSDLGAGADTTGLLLLGSVTSGSSIKRLDFYNASTAIVGTHVFADTAPSGVSVEGNWLGMDLNQSPGTTADSNETGISTLGDGWDIGGATAQERNVLRSNSVGVRIFGGDSSTIAGNYFGTRADGTPDNAFSAPSIALQGISASEPGIPNGTTIGGPDTGTPGTCDGACNLFAAPSGGVAHVDTDAGAFPAGSTTIQGNFVNLDLTGAIVGGGFGIDVGASDAVTIGGATATARNYIGGGLFGGVFTGTGADDLTIQNNFFGVQPDGSGAVASSGPVGAEISSTAAVGDRPVISDNLFAGDSTPGQDGLRLTGTGGTVTGNSFGRDATSADQPFGADAVEISGSVYTFAGNQVRNGREFGININNGDFNQVNGNTIEGNGAAAAGAGVRIHNDADGNVLGGDPVGTPGEVNTFVANAGDAIEVLDNASTGNLLLGNLTNGVDSATGGAAGDLIIDLNGDGFGNPPVTGPNEGVQPPAITAVSATSASGTATPNAQVLLYGNSGTETGAPQPAAILGEAIADGSGNWTIAHAGIPPGRFVFAGQSVLESSSELAGPVQFVPPSTPPPGGGDAGTTPVPIASIPSPPTPTAKKKKKKCKKGFVLKKIKGKKKCVRKKKRK